MKTKAYGIRPKTISKYLNCLTAFQQRSGSISNLTEITSKLSVSSNIGSFLYRKGIIYKKDNLYYWNDVYEPNVKIVKAILNDKSVKNDKYLESVNKKSTPNLFDKKNNLENKIKIEVLEPQIIEEIEKISIRDAVKTFGKSDSYFRRIQREWKVSKPKAVFMYEGKVHFDLNELNKKLKKNFVEKVKEQPNVNNTAQIGVIRKFIKWLW